MKLSSEQQEKLNKFVTAKWRPPFQCPYCQTNNWNITQEIFQLTEFSNGALTVGGPVVPIAPVTCNNCGNTVLLNAIIAGVIEPSKEEVKKDGQ